MEQYNEKIAENANAEFVHISLDQSDDAAKAWAEKENFPWLTVLPDDVDRSGLSKYHTSNSVPFYVLLDREGNPVAKGSAAAFAQIESAGE